MEITSDQICVWVDGTIEPGIESASIYSEVSLADLHVYAYHDTRWRERETATDHRPPFTIHVPSLRASLSLSLRSNRSTCQSYALYRFHVRPYLRVFSRWVSNSNTLRFLRGMVNINWFRADPSLSQGSVIERATWLDIFLFLESL